MARDGRGRRERARLTFKPTVDRIGTCRKKVMGLLRLMGNKADVVKGLAKRCNENWSVAPKSDIVSPPPSPHHFKSKRTDMCATSSRIRHHTGSLSLRYPRSSDHHDPELESLRKDLVSFSFQLLGSDFHRDDGCE